MCSSGSGTTQDAQRSQNAFSRTLQQAFESQFHDNTRLTQLINGLMWNQINAGGRGFSPQALAAMRTQATDNLSGQYQNAQRALQEKEFSQGGRDLPSGVNAQLDADLYAQEAQQKAAAENSITLANEEQRQNNYWRAIGTLSGNNAERNPLGFAGAANSAAGAEAALSDANTKANQSGFGGSLSTSLGEGIGRELTGGNSTGSGTAGGFFGL